MEAFHDRDVGGKRPFAVEGRELFVAASIGIALGDARTKTPEDLVRDADMAMYKAKEFDTSYSVFDTAMYERVVGRLEMENALRRAVERGEFVLHYQPIVHLKDDGGVWGMEALVRWEHRSEDCWTRASSFLSPRRAVWWSP